MTPIFFDVRHHTSIEDHLPIVCGITSAIKVDLVHNQTTFLGMTRCASRSPVWSKYSNSPSHWRLRFYHRPRCGLSSTSLSSPLLSWHGVLPLAVPAVAHHKPL